MSFFSKILDKLGLGKKEEPAAVKPAAPAAKAAPAVSARPAGMTRAEKDDLVQRGPAKPAAIPEVDVVKKIEKMAEGSGLDWKASIVDLLKILGLDSSKEARIELAKELGCPADLIGGDYSKMNVWLHKEVLRRIAQNGGNIPANMLD